MVGGGRVGWRSRDGITCLCEMYGRSKSMELVQDRILSKFLG